MDEVYIRTQIQNPVLSLTASVTLRDAPIKKKNANAETSSIMSSSSTIRTDGTDEVDETLDEDDLASMQEIDLLGGLGELPFSRNGWDGLTDRRGKDAFFEVSFECKGRSVLAESTSWAVGTCLCGNSFHCFTKLDELCFCAFYRWSIERKAYSAYHRCVIKHYAAQVVSASIGIVVRSSSSNENVVPASATPTSTRRRGRHRRRRGTEGSSLCRGGEPA